jgi:hypothetical protein
MKYDYIRFLKIFNFILKYISFALWVLQYIFLSFGATAPVRALAYLHWNSPFHFRFLDLRHSVGLLGRVISSSQGLYLYTNTEKRTYTHKHQTSMPWVWFEPTIPASERAKTVHALDSSATVTGLFNTHLCKISRLTCNFVLHKMLLLLPIIS